jgi:hypothetical protein
VTVALSTEDCRCKVAMLLEDPAYRRLDTNPTEALERKTSVPIRRSSPPEEAPSSCEHVVRSQPGPSGS